MTTDASDRYSRQQLLPEIGIEGQRRLAGSCAAVVGCGALGTMQAALLVRAGVGRTLLIDRDFVEASNLQRQVLFDERDAERGVPKAEAAALSLRQANSAVSVVPIVKDVVPTNAERLLEPADVILDGTDNFETRFLINEVAVKRSIPWIYGAAVSTQGSVMPILPGQTACLECLFDGIPESRQPTCDTVGVLNAVTSLIASLQVVEALKILTGRAEDVEAKLVTIDVWSGERAALDTDIPHLECPTCGGRRFSRLASQSSTSARICGRDAVQVPARDRPVDLVALAQSLSPLGEVRASELAVRFLCPPYALTVFPDGRAIVKGTQDLGVARSLYARYVGD